MRPLKGYLSLFAMLAGCGARSTLVEASVDAGVVEDTGEPADVDVADAAVVADAGPAADARPPACTFVVGAPQTVVEMPYDVTAGGVLARGDHALVTWTSSNGPSPDPRWHVARVDAFGRPTGDDAILVDHVGMFGAPSLAEGHGLRAAVTWSSGGAYFVPIAANGAPTSSPVWLYTLGIRALRAYPDGFTALDYAADGNHLLALARDGALLARRPLIEAAERGFWFQRAFRDDGGFVLAWMTGRTAPSRVSIRSFDRHGALLGATHELAALTPQAAVVAVAPAGDGFLVGWIDGDRNVQRVRVASDGTPLDAPHPLPDARARTRNDLVFARVRDAVVAAWVDAIEPTRWALHVQQLDARGEPDGPLQTVDGTPFALGPRLVATDEGALVVFTGSGDGARNRVFAAPLTCR